MYIHCQLHLHFSLNELSFLTRVRNGARPKEELWLAGGITVLRLLRRRLPNRLQLLLGGLFHYRGGVWGGTGVARGGGREGEGEVLGTDLTRRERSHSELQLSHKMDPLELLHNRVFMSRASSC